MPEVVFLPLGASVQAEPGTPIMDAARAAGIAMASECGGKGTCSSCLLMVEQGSVDGDSAAFLPLPAIEEGYVLACRSRVGNGPLVLRLAGGGEKAETGQIARAEAASCADVDPAVRRATLVVPNAEAEDGLSDLERLEKALAPVIDAPAVECPLPVLRLLAQGLRGQSGRATVVRLERENGTRLLDIAPGSPAGPLTGAAVDLGTTTVSVQVLDLESGKVLATASAYNPQLACGLDVISRINFAQRSGGLERLRELGAKGINDLLRVASAEAGQSALNIMAVSLAGNTVMVHLLLGMEPEYIRLAPYTPTAHRPGPFTAQDVGLDAHAMAPVSLAPGVGSYVGGDVVSGLLCTPLADANGDGVRLYLDIGTNGEVVLGDGDFLMACACSSGPAFEGGGIGCGMRASTGAVERARIDPETGEPSLSVIGGCAPTGVCGSGIIDLVAGLFGTGWLDSAGKLDRERPCARIRVSGRQAAYVLATAEESGRDEEIALTEADIDNLMRAKAAVYAGCALLLEQAGLDFPDLAEVIVAGGFGRYLDVESAVTIGLLPDLPREKFRFLGNASLSGAARTLLSRAEQTRLADLASRITYLELSTEPAYMSQYTAALFLPHTEAARFPSIGR